MSVDDARLFWDSTHISHTLTNVRASRSAAVGPHDEGKVRQCRANVRVHCEMCDV